MKKQTIAGNVCASLRSSSDLSSEMAATPDPGQPLACAGRRQTGRELRRNVLEVERGHQWPLWGSTYQQPLLADCRPYFLFD